MQKQRQQNLLRLMLFVSLCFLVESCSMDSCEITDFGFFTASLPASWQKIELKGLDSKVYNIITDKNDTLFIDFGRFSNPFNEVIEVRTLERKSEYDSVKFRYPSSMVFSEDAEMDQAQGLYLKEYFFYENIDGKKAKLGFPKVTKKGRCLLYISKADKSGNKLSIYVNNVDSNIQREVYKLFKSIRITPPVRRIVP